jgi:DNA-binding GntR family transcriptional regulator
MRVKGEAILKIHRLPLGRRAADVMREEIVSGRFAPGARLVESELAQLLGVSRGTIRSALAELAHEGLVEQIAYTKWCVPSLVARDAWELCTIRAALEGLASYLASEMVKAHGNQELSKSFDLLMNAAASGNVVEANNADMRLHKTIVALAGNRRLAKQYELIENQVRRYIFCINALMPKTHDVAEEHRPLVDAILAGMPDKAESLAKAHALGQRHRLYEHLKEVEGSSISGEQMPASSPLGSSMTARP